MDAYTSSTKMKKLLIILLLPLAAFAQVQTGSMGDLFITGQAAQTATVNNIIPATAGTDGTDMSGYGSALVQIVSTGTGGTFIFEGSNFLNTNYQTIPVWNQATATGTPIIAAITATASQIGYWIPKKFRYIRCRIATTITGGSVQAVTTLSRTDTDPNYFQVANATAANLNATVTATNLSTNVAQMNGVAVSMGNGVAGTGVQRVAIASDNTANSNPWLVTLRGATANGTTTSFLNSAATTNATNLKASAGTVYTIFANNTTASAKYLRLYNLATAPTVGTSTPVMVVTIPASGSISVSVPAFGIAFSTGISYAITNAAAYLDATAVAAGDVQVLIGWQ